MVDGWREDILGGGFEQLTLPLDAGPDEDLVATLVRAPAPPLGGFARPLADVDVLYVHGWSDYFFQVDLARRWTRLGARFYALDLRRYGRSLRPSQTPGFISDLATYDEDIAAARAAMGPGRRLILMGHSTGGLTLTLWADRHRGEADALVLNSPWLELQGGGWGREAIAPLVALRAKYDPRGRQPVVDEGFYTRAQRELGTLPTQTERETWRPDTGFQTHAAWFSAILRGHEAVQRGVDVGCPTLVMLSTASTFPFRWSNAMLETDSVLDVDSVAVAATRIGSLVTLARIPGAVHDVFLSAPDARERAYETLSGWVVAQAGLGFSGAT